MSSEYLRAKILVSLFAFSLFCFVGIYIFFNETYEKLFQGKLPIWIVVIFVVTIIIYEVISSTMIRKAIRENK